jgi:hypothetical protein
LGLSYKGELLLAFEFAVFSGRFKLALVSSGEDHFMSSSQRAMARVVLSSDRARIIAARLAQCPLERPARRGTQNFCAPSMEISGNLD